MDKLDQTMSGETVCQLLDEIDGNEDVKERIKKVAYKMESALFLRKKMMMKFGIEGIYKERKLQMRDVGFII